MNISRLEPAVTQGEQRPHGETAPRNNVLWTHRSRRLGPDSSDLRPQERRTHVNHCVTGQTTQAWDFLGSENRIILPRRLLARRVSAGPEAVVPASITTGPSCQRCCARMCGTGHGFRAAVCVWGITALRAPAAARPGLPGWAKTDPGKQEPRITNTPLASPASS